MSNWKIVATDGAACDLQDKYNFKVEQQMGSGMPPVSTISTPFGLLDGALFQRQQAEVRTFTLVGTLAGSSVADLHVLRKNLINAIKPDRTASPGEAVVVQYTGAATTKQASCHYDAGMEFKKAEKFRESQLGLRFVVLDPYWEETTATSATLGVLEEVAGVNRIVQRTASGNWVALDSGVNNTVNVVFEAGDGTLYAGGFFTTAGSDAISRIASWSGTNWSDMDGGVGGGGDGPLTIAEGPDGTIYVGGDFTTAGGSTVNRIVSWDGVNWTDLGGVDGRVEDTLVDIDGTLYISGGFSTVDGGGTNASGFASYDGVNWAAHGASLKASDGTAIAKGLGGLFYVGGAFTDVANGTTACLITEWDKTTWSAVGSGFQEATSVTPTVLAITVGPDGTVYAGGTFDKQGGAAASISSVSRWNGNNWQTMGDGLGKDTATTAQVNTIAVDDNNTVFAGGNFNKIGSNSQTGASRNLLETMAKWNQSVWLPTTIKFPGSGNIVQSLDINNGVLTVGGGFSGTASAAAKTAVTNNGTATAYPVFTASGPGQLYELSNYTTGESVFFDLILNSGETVTLDLRPGKKTFVSDFRGNILDTVMPGSDLVTWRLLPGANNVVLFIDDGSAAAKVEYTERYWSVDD